MVGRASGNTATVAPAACRGSGLHSPATTSTAPVSPLGRPGGQAR